MPKMDGIETVKKLRKMGYSGAIVALTANALTGNEEMFARHGFDGFIPKPIDVRRLNMIVNKFVRDRHPEESAQTAQIAAVPHEVINAQEAAALQAAAAEADKTRAKLLQVFRRDAEKALAALRAATAAMHEKADFDYSADGDLKLFTTTVHAMKSALASVGETELSHRAAALEKAGFSGDTGFIAANTESFVAALESLIKKLSPAPTAAAEDANVTEDTAFLKEQMQIIKTACAKFDDTSAYAALDRLKEKSWKPQTVATLEKIRDTLFLHSDFDEAAELAGEIDKH